MIDSDMSRANMQTGSNTRGGDGVSCCKDHSDKLASHYMEWWKEAAEDADRRGELLRRAYIIYMDTGKIPTHLLLEIHRELKYPKETADD